MRIGIDFHAAEQEGTGNCTYIRRLVESLLTLNGDHEYFLYITDPSRPYYEYFRHRPSVCLRNLPARNALARTPALGLKTLADKLDILHVQYVAPPIHAGKLVVTVHDISFARIPGYFSRGLRLYLKTLVPFSLKKASGIITISEYSKQDIGKRYSVPTERIHITPLAAGPEFKPDETPETRQTLLRRLGFQGPYILYVGRLDPRKNVVALTRAFADLKKTGNIPHRLVIAGRGNSQPERFRSDVEKAGLGRQAVWTGFIPDELLPSLFSQAEVFVYPSLYEGFGLPPLEAMACGCPVIASNVTALPEVIGTAGLLIDPAQTASLVEAILKVISDKALREKMRRDGLAQSRKFSWTDTARKTLAVYEAMSRRPQRNGIGGRIPDRS